MSIETMAYEDLKVLVSKLRELILYPNYPGGTIDIDEINIIYDKAIIELSKREQLKSDDSSIIGHYYIFWTYAYYVACKVKNIKDNYCICDCLILNIDDEDDFTVKFIENKNCKDVYDGFMLYPTEDKRLEVYFHDDEGGRSFAKEISKLEYDNLKLNIDNLERVFISLGVEKIKNF